MTRDEARERARALAREAAASGDAIGWFEKFYAEARGDAEKVPWIDAGPHPLLAEWLARGGVRGEGKRALVVGCGVGDDAEGLARAGFAVTGFDLSPTAIAWARKRFPGSAVAYEVADLFAAPARWLGAFDLVFECYTVQALPLELRARAFPLVAGFVAPQGTLLVVARGRDDGEPLAELPWPLSRAELAAFEAHGLALRGFDDVLDAETPPVRRFRAEYRRR